MHACKRTGMAGKKQRGFSTALAGGKQVSLMLGETPCGRVRFPEVMGRDPILVLAGRAFWEFGFGRLEVANPTWGCIILTSVVY